MADETARADMTVGDYDDDPNQEVEMGDIEARMDEMQEELDQLAADEELDEAIDSNTLADNSQLDEA